MLRKNEMVAGLPFIQGSKVKDVFMENNIEIVFQRQNSRQENL
eukprot:Gb_12806 [translate_table: standard]